MSKKPQTVQELAKAGAAARWKKYPKGKARTRQLRNMRRGNKEFWANVSEEEMAEIVRKRQETREKNKRAGK